MPRRDRFPPLVAAVRIAGLGLLLLCGGLWGLTAARELAGRARLLLQLRQTAERFIAGVDTAALPLARLVRENPGCPFCGLAAQDPAFPDRPRLALEHAGERLLRREEDLALYRAFVAGLGSGDRESTLRHLSLYARLLEESAASARREQEEKGRLSLCLGLCAGAGLGLLLL